MSTQFPQPGIHIGVPAATYHAFDAVSASRLQKLSRSPLHCRHAIDHPDQHDTPALAFGRAVHAAILEPDVFHQQFAVAPNCDRRTKDGKAAYEAFVAANQGKEIVAPDDFASAVRIAEVVHAHPFAGKLLKLRESTEVSAVWRDEKTGLTCKGRADALSPRVKTVIDIKTTEDASPDEFERSVFKWGYYRQAAFYLDGLKACGLDYTRFVIVAVEKKPPHGICVFQLDEDSIDYGRKDYRSLLNVYRRCVDSGEWPGYPPQVQTIGLPEWARRRLDMVVEAA